MAQFRLPEMNTRFELPIIHPTTREVVSAETLYNDTCDALGYVVRDNIGDLIFDNLDYSKSHHGTNKLFIDVYDWASRVRKLLPS